MLEIFAMLYLGKTIKEMVEPKGLSAAKYILIMLGLWLGCEFFGVVLGTLFFEEMFKIYIMGLLGAGIGGYLAYTVAYNADPIEQN